jgi:DNA mismatch repair protein MutS
MTKPSILFNPSKDVTKENQVAPEYFMDLNLDQIVESITAYKEEYDLKPFFYTPLKDLDAIKYRHEVMRDLENPDLVAKIQKFAQKMRKIRDYVTQITKLYHRYQKESWFLDVVEIYCEAVNDLLEAFDR